MHTHKGASARPEIAKTFREGDAPFVLRQDVRTVEAPAAPLGCTLTGLFLSLLLQARIEDLEEELEAERAMRTKVRFAAAAKHLPV